MSPSAAHESKTLRRHCQSCHAHKARSAIAATSAPTATTQLCFECLQSERDRRRARSLANAKPLKSPFRQNRLSEDTIAHRRLMLAHLAGSRSQQV